MPPQDPVTSLGPQAEEQLRAAFFKELEDLVGPNWHALMPLLVFMEEKLERFDPSLASLHTPQIRDQFFRTLVPVFIAYQRASIHHKIFVEEPGGLLDAFTKGEMN